MNALTQVNGPTVLMPAYGRVYETKADMLADWNAGKDFQIAYGPYCSLRDLDYLRETSSSIVLMCWQTQISVTL